MAESLHNSGEYLSHYLTSLGMLVQMAGKIGELSKIRLVPASQLALLIGDMASE